MKLPIGIQSFENIRADGYIYADKTQNIYTMIQQSKYNFLSRPRRFGKSLLVDTVKCLYEGKKELFTWCRIVDHRDWSTQYPVLKISFGSGAWKKEWAIEARLREILWKYQAVHEIEFDTPMQTIEGIFLELIQKLQEKYQQKVVILIDEYDKPLLDVIDDPKKAKENTEVIKSFYGALKDADERLEQVFLTGITKFSKVSLFSGLNNLRDITLVPEFGEICGYTLREIRTWFASYLVWVDQEKMKKRYNGFNFLGEHKVFNPYDVLLFLQNRTYKNYWFETATPTYLVTLLKSKRVFYYLPALETFSAGEELLSSFDLDNIDIKTLLFQAGYLTIQKQYTVLDDIIYDLVVPNHEIKRALNNYLIDDYLGFDDIWVKSTVQIAMVQAIATWDVDGFIAQIKVMFASISYHNHTKNTIANYEWYYSSVVYAMLYAIGFDIIAEETTNQWRIDMVIRYELRIYVIEFKVEQTWLTALEQIKERGYTQKYATYESVYLIGIDFDKQKKQVREVEWEKEIGRM